VGELLPTFAEWEERVARVYIESDIYTLFRMTDLETVVSKFYFEREMPAQEQEKAAPMLYVRLAAYHDALPFSAAERRALAMRCSTMNERPVVEERLRLEAATMTESGLRRVVQGGDLVRRWWSWRRQTDEFAGQGSADLAHRALGDIAWRFMPKPLPGDLLASVDGFDSPDDEEEA
jgi:hypothetical protein